MVGEEALEVPGMVDLCLPARGPSQLICGLTTNQSGASSHGLKMRDREATA